MNQTIKQFIKDQFGLSNNSVVKIIILNTICTLSLLIFKLILNLGGMDLFYSKIESFLSLSTDLNLLYARPWSLFTYTLVEYNLFSFFWAVLFLRFFGRIISTYLGDQYFLKIYFISAIASGLFVLGFYNFLPKFIGHRSLLIGLQGCVYGILTVATILAPNFPINVFIFSVQLKYVFIFFILQSLYKLDEGSTVGIAQLGGSLSSYLYMKFLRFVNFKKLFNFKKKKKKGGIDVFGLDMRANGESKEATIDEILDKIAKFGYSSLSLEEKKRIFKRDH